MVKRILVFLIRQYQGWVSPVMPPCCRYYPTCSEYTTEAIQKKGVIKGLLFGMWRILRCNPWSKGGFDPVIKNEEAKS